MVPPHGSTERQGKKYEVQCLALHSPRELRGDSGLMVRISSQCWPTPTPHWELPLSRYPPAYNGGRTTDFPRRPCQLPFPAEGVRCTPAGRSAWRTSAPITGRGGRPPAALALKWTSEPLSRVDRCRGPSWFLARSNPMSSIQTASRGARPQGVYVEPSPQTGEVVSALKEGPLAQRCQARAELRLQTRGG